jgi:glutathione S-transferase
LHPEPIPSAQARYAAEIRRVLKVIDDHLTRTGRPYLVGDKISYVDLMFVAWNWQLRLSMGPDFPAEWKEKYPKCWDWNERMFKRDSAVAAEKFALDAWNASGPPMELQSHSTTLSI